MIKRENKNRLSYNSVAKGVGTGGGDYGAKEEDASGAKLRCSVCGEYVPRLYQNDTCKPCLVASFKRLKVMIDGYRGSGDDRGLREDS